MAGCRHTIEAGGRPLHVCEVGDPGGKLAPLHGPVGAFLISALEEGTRPGLGGRVDDDLAFVAWPAGRLPRADARMSPDEGHLERRAPDVHAFLAERLT